MRSSIGDNANIYIPLHPNRNEIGTMSYMPRKFTKFSGNALYWILQLALLVINISVNILCNPIVWFMLKTIFNVLTDVFIYLVLGVCSFLISIITHLDDYYTRGRHQDKKSQNLLGVEELKEITLPEEIKEPVSKGARIST